MLLPRRFALSLDGVLARLDSDDPCVLGGGLTQEYTAQHAGR